MEQYVDDSFGIYPEADAPLTEDLFVCIDEVECLQHGHVEYVFTFADTEAGIKAQKHVAELMKQEDSYDLDLWLDAVVDCFGTDLAWAPVVRNDRIEISTVLWA